MADNDILGRRGGFAGDWESRLAWWTDERLAGRIAAIRTSTERRREILSACDGMEGDTKRYLAYSRNLTRPATDRLVGAVMAEVESRDGDGGGGWDDISGLVGIAPGGASANGFSSFRIAKTALVEMIGFDYDGYAFPGGGFWDVPGLAGLASELAQMAALAYANIPERYWPLELTGDAWTIRGFSPPAMRGGERLVVPLSCLAIEEDEIGDDEDGPTRRAQLLVDEWWGRFLDARADDVERGRMTPLPIETQEGVVMTDASAMLACAALLRFWLTVRNSVPDMVRDGDGSALCAVIDEMLASLRGAGPLIANPR